MKNLNCPHCQCSLSGDLLRATPAHPRGEIVCPTCKSVSGLPQVSWWPVVVALAAFVGVLLLKDTFGMSRPISFALAAASVVTIVVVLAWTRRASKLALIRAEA
jgi:hypothetical protein